MTADQVVFFIIATVTVVSSLMMVAVPRVFHAALLMILAFLGIGALYMQMGAGFLGVIQVLIYVGAIAVLMIFAIMLTPKVMDSAQQRFTGQWPLAALLAAGLSTLLVQQIARSPFPTLGTDAINSALTGRDYAIEIGLHFMDTGLQGYLLPFEVASLLLLVALVGAIAIAGEETQ
jgi:NADH:ubiquinone oxidoreductase subunit 6 (subunit J)